ncbi:MAG: hypothetical protein MJ237_01525 [bacterium]|nr:hypothetical protein [bacterium]
MDRDELILSEYRLYVEQKDNFTDRNFATNRFYMFAFLAVIFSLIFTGNIVFMEHVSATLLFSIIGIFVCVLWWVNVDAYNMLIKIKFSSVIEKIEEKLPVKPFSDEYQGIEEFRKKKVFMFSDIQKIIAIFGALFFFAIFVSEVTPFAMAVQNKLVQMFNCGCCGI